MRVAGYLIFALMLGAPASSFAQENPFAPPPPRGGLSRAEIAEIARNEARSQAEKEAATPDAATPAPTPAPAPAPVQAGTPNGSPVDGNGALIPVAPVILDPVEQLISDGGVFVGCIGDTPVFKDKFGRRTYFTSKELKESNEARRYIRC